MFMTYNEAMVIQRAQMAYYRQMIGRKGCKAIRSRTHCPPDLDPNKPIFVGDINGMVPRGGSFENYIRTYPKDRDTTALHWHNAIRKGLV